MTNGKSALSAPELAYEWLKNTIVTLPRSEEMFLTEAQVAASSGISRTPVREALLRLEAQGFVRRVPHKGAFIPALSDSDVEMIMQARGVVEEWSVREVSARPGFLPSRLDAILDKQAADTDPVEFIAHDLEFHTAIIGAAGNSILGEFYDTLRVRQMRMGVRIVTTHEERFQQVIVEHRAIADAIAAADPDAAVTAVRGHLHSTLQSMKERH